jgi:ABC-type proline/glycine betaine transport system substrate-binding protein
MRKMLIVALAAAALLAPGAQAKHGPDDHAVTAPEGAIAAPSGFAWRDAGVGASVTALVLGGIGCGVALTVRHRRPARA